MQTARLFLIMLLAVVSAGCELIVGIFEAGLIVGIILVLLIVGVVFWIVRKLSGPSGPRV